ncbi:MAG: ATP synthase F0 subunit C [Clostridiales bacterium]|nr:ATP synthase F0 subunit C [Clostridiales bacterium]
MSTFLSIAAIELKGIYALAAALAIGLAAVAGAFAMAMAISKAIEAIARQPEAESKIKSILILGLVFIETAIIYALVISILVVINVL